MNDEPIHIPDFLEFQALAMRTANRMGREKDLIHAAMGLTSEAGEFMDAIKANFAYNKELDFQNLVEELGDILWFTALACNSLGIPMSVPAHQCIEKLRIRYPDQFTNEAAIARADKQ